MGLVQGTLAGSIVDPVVADVPSPEEGARPGGYVIV